MLEYGYGVIVLKIKFAFGFLFHITEICINMLLSISIVTSLVNTIPLYSLLYDILSNDLLDVCGHKYNFLFFYANWARCYIIQTRWKLVVIVMLDRWLKTSHCVKHVYEETVTQAFCQMVCE